MDRTTLYTLVDRDLLYSLAVKIIIMIKKKPAMNDETVTKCTYLYIQKQNNTRTYPCITRRIHSCRISRSSTGYQP